MKLKFRNLISVRWWACAFRYTRGVIRYAYGKYDDSIADFQWILKDGSFAPVSCLVYENLGINYARLKDFAKAEEYFIKSGNDKTQEDNGYLFMWLGYIHLISETPPAGAGGFFKATCDKPA